MTSRSGSGTLPAGGGMCLSSSVMGRTRAGCATGFGLAPARRSETGVTGRFGARGGIDFAVRWGDACASFGEAHALEMLDRLQ